MQKLGIAANNFYSMLEALQEVLDDETYRLVRHIIYKFITHYF